MKITRLMKEVKCNFPITKVGEYDPYVEYFLLDEEQKHCFILRNAADDKIEVINLKYANPNPHLIDNSEFSNLCDKYTVLELPHFNGGCFDYTPKVMRAENQARKEMFVYLLDNGYFD